MVDVNGHCLVDVDGKLLEPNAAADAIKGKAKPSSQIDLIAASNAPYRCVGAAVFYLQRAGFTDVSLKTR